jgi:hypothetical protein
MDTFEYYSTRAQNLASIKLLVIFFNVHTSPILMKYIQPQSCPVSYPAIQQTYVLLHLSSIVSRSTITQNHRKWLLTIIISCIIAIFILLAVFLSR